MATASLPRVTRPYVADPRDIAAITGKPVSECRVHPMHLKPCETCRRGCNCDGAAGDLDCGHYGCWGRSRRPEAEIARCYGVAYERARQVALSTPLAQEQLPAARRRGHDVYLRVQAQILTAAQLAVTED